MDLSHGLPHVASHMYAQIVQKQPWLRPECFLSHFLLVFVHVHFWLSSRICTLKRAQNDCELSYNHFSPIFC